jgi:uncharacterized protein (DUF2267 family)
MAECLRGKGMAAEKFGLDEFVKRVSQHTGLTISETTDGVRAVFRTLGEAAPSEEFGQAMSQLPAEFRTMLEPTG